MAKVISFTWSSGDPEKDVPPSLVHIKITNHTSCECNCKYNEEVCNQFQFWDSSYCKCKCLRWNCPRNFQKHPNTCCSCPIREKVCMGRKQIWNRDACACVCKNLAKPCKIGFKIRDPATCKCVCPLIKCKQGYILNKVTCYCEQKEETNRFFLVMHQVHQDNFIKENK